MNLKAITPEPSRIMLIWQSGSPSVRTKFVVGELCRSMERVSLQYAFYEADLQNAISAGFVGHPAFPLNIAVHHYNVLEVFSRRLPQRSRMDYAVFLERHRINPEQLPSDFGILGYTGGSLPSDGFSCAVDFRYEPLPHLFLMEVAGFRYHSGMNMQVSDLMGKQVVFSPEMSNPHDPAAVRVYVGDNHVGYVPRYYSSLARTWIERGMIHGIIERLDGTLTKPQLHMFVSVMSNTSYAAKPLLSYYGA